MQIKIFLSEVKQKSNKVDHSVSEPHHIYIRDNGDGNEWWRDGDMALSFRVRAKGVDIKVRSDIMVWSEYWDNSLPGYKRTRKVSAEVQKAMKTLLNEIMEKLTDEYNQESANSNWVKSVISDCLRSKDELLPSIADRIEQYCMEHELAKGSRCVFIATSKKVRRYEAYRRTVDGEKGYCMCVETITADDYNDFREYIINEHRLYEEYPEVYVNLIKSKRSMPRQLSNTTVIHAMQHLRVVHFWCLRMGITDNKSCMDISIPEPTYGSPFYLTLEERNQLYEADLSDDASMQLCRDKFVFQSLIGCRIGDLDMMTRDNIHGDLLQYIPHKTKHRNADAVTVPLNKKAQTILSRYHEDDGHLFPSLQSAAYNEGIRAVMHRCGINRMVTVFNTQTMQEEQRAICDIATSHTARKTFIGNIYKKVHDPLLISSMTGHVNGSRSFARYREIDDDIKQELVDMIN